MLTGKTIVVGVSGGIAAYKACELVSRLKQANADVRVAMTKNAARFVAPLTFETLSGNEVICDTFDRATSWEPEHITLAKKADLFVLAPASANLMAKYACGIADDFLTTTLLAATCRVLIAPAMNTNMYLAAATQTNMLTLSARGCEFVEAESGRLACGDVGKGRMAEPETIFDRIVKLLTTRKDFAGKTVLVTAGATREKIDPVRFVSNSSSGKMGASICRALSERGAKVILVAGFTSVTLCADEIIEVGTTCEMYDAVMQKLPECDIVIKAAAPADYCVTESQNKIKSQTLTLQLKKNPDIAAAVGKIKESRKLVIFCAESENLLDNARKKLVDKNADMVVANDVTQNGAGFNVDTNIVTVITKKKEKQYGVMSKDALAHVLLDEISAL